MSDLHCHGKDEYPQAESLLIAGDLRMPSDRHPGQALVDLIDQNQLRVDILLSPGDLANKMSQVGMVDAYRELCDLSGALNAQLLLATIGNHDVASRERAGDPFRIAKNLHPDFPVKDRVKRNQYWSDGFFIASFADQADVVVLNTAYHHYSEPESRSGTFPYEQIKRLDQELSEMRKPPLRLALLHHHPILHSTGSTASGDVLPTGDQLLHVLLTHGCQILIHGHRHEPRVSRYLAAGQEAWVFAAGSFSILLRELGTTTRNLFHLLDLTIDEDRSLTGLIRTWEFRYSAGWTPSTRRSAGVPHEIRLGRAPSQDLLSEVPEWLRANTRRYIGRGSLTTRFPLLSALLPTEFDKLVQNIEAIAGLKVERDEYGNLRGVGRIRDPRL